MSVDQRHGVLACRSVVNGIGRNVLIWCNRPLSGQSFSQAILSLVARVMLTVQTSVKLAMLAATTVHAAHVCRAVTAWLQDRRRKISPEILQCPVLVAGMYKCVRDVVGVGNASGHLAGQA